MAINIGHASLDENGKISGGAAGDQTGKEVCVRSWYSKPWGFVLRCTDPSLAEKMAKACEAGCANNKIGYDQNQRNTLNTQAKKVDYDLSKITTLCECDCSSLMTVCAQAAGIEPAYSSGNAPTTSTMQARFKATGKFTVLTDSKYLTSDKYLKRGDILVKAGSHTAMALGNGSLSGSTTSTSSSTSTSTSSSGKLDVDGEWGTATTRRMQQVLGTAVDGIVSNQYSAYKASNPGLLSSSWQWVSKPSSGSPMVKALQKLVSATQDGYIGTNTIKAMQKYFGTVQDGKVSNPSLLVKAIQKWLNSK